VERDQEECVRLLLQYNADLTLKNDYNDSIFELAYRKNNINIMEILLSHYENKYHNGLCKGDDDDDDHDNDDNSETLMDDRNLISNGKTLLMLACSQGNEAMIKMLIKHHIDASFKNFDGNTALHISCQHRNSEVAEMLLQYQPEIIDIQNKKGKTSLMIVCKLDDSMMVSLLLNYQANVNLKDHNGKTALMIACKYSHINTIHYLIDHHWNQRQKDSKKIGSIDHHLSSHSNSLLLSNKVLLRKSKTHSLNHKIKIHQHFKTMIKPSNPFNNNTNTKNYMDSSDVYLLNKFKKYNLKGFKSRFNKSNSNHLIHALPKIIKFNNVNKTNNIFFHFSFFYYYYFIII